MSLNLTIVGVGALGSHLVQFIRNEPAEIKVIDFDRVEARNTQSQFHGRPACGKLKVESLRQVMQFSFGLKVAGVPHRLTSDNAEVLLADSDLVVDCLDNGEARRLVQAVVRKHTVPCVHGALAPDGSFGRIVWDEKFVIDDEATQGAVTCEHGEFLPFIALVSAYLARSVQLFLAAGKKVGYQVSPVGAVAI